MVYISRSCFCSARHNTGVWQTDGRTRRCRKDRASIVSRGYKHWTFRHVRPNSSSAHRNLLVVCIWVTIGGQKWPKVKLLNFFLLRFYSHEKQESRAVATKPRDAAAVVFGLKFADNIHYKFKGSQASKARLQSSKCTGAKQNLTQNGRSMTFKVTCFGISGKAIRDVQVIRNKYQCWPYLLTFRRCIASTKKIRSFSADSKYSGDHIPLLRFPHLRQSLTSEPSAALLVAICHKRKTWTWKRLRHAISVYNIWA